MNRITTNSFNLNSLLNNKNPQPFTVESVANPNGFNNENLNLIRNIENLKRLWQTNNKIENENGGFNNVETINQQYFFSDNGSLSNSSLNLVKNNGNMRTFADVAKTTTPSPTIIPSSSSPSSISSSTSSSISPPIFKSSIPQKTFSKNKITNTKSYPTSSNCRSKNSIFSSGSLESIDDVNTVKKYKKNSKKNNKNGSLKTTAPKITSQSSLTSDDDKDYTEIIDTEISLRDIKPDSKYGLDSFEKTDLPLES